MKIKIFHVKFIQNGYYSKAVVYVNFNIFLTKYEKTSLLKELNSFSNIKYPWYDKIHSMLGFYVEADTKYDAEREIEPFDKIKGHDIAENKAVIKAYKTAIKVLRHLEKIRAREMNNLEDVISSKLSKQLDIRSEIIGD